MPRLSLTFSREDPFAVRVAARVKAAWEELGLGLDLDGAGGAEFRERARRGEFVAALLLHQPPTADPVLGMHGSLAATGSTIPDAIAALEEASRVAEPEERLLAAGRAEAALLRDARLIPLVRLHAWLATDARLVGIESGPAGTLRLDDAWLLP